jgi:ABC-type branched-subunit amino acid transport system substrate-binding protein
MRKHVGVRTLIGLIVGVAAIAAMMSSVATARPRAHGAAATIKILDESGVGSPLGSYPGDWGGAQAAALATNKAGGINGAKVDVTLCNDHQLANGAATCGHEAASDHVAAVVGWTGFDPELNPILYSAKIPVFQWVISDYAQTLSGQGPWSIQYPLNGAALPEWIGEVYAAKAAGAKSIAFMLVNYPGLSTVVSEEQQAAKKLGLKDLGIVNTTETQTSFSSTAQSLATLKPDAVLLNATAPQEDATLEAATQIGFSPTWISDSGTFNPETFAAFAKLAPKEWISSTVPPATDNAVPAIATFNKEMNAAAAAGISNAAVGNRDESTEFTWLSTHAFFDLAKTIKGAVTNTSVLAALKTAKSINVEGLITWSPAAKGLPMFGRVTDGGIAYWGPVKNGVYTPSSHAPVLKESGL